MFKVFEGSNRDLCEDPLRSLSKDLNRNFKDLAKILLRTLKILIRS